MGHFIVLTGPTASGKDSVLQKLLKKNPNLRKVVTNTTRTIRPRERDGADYNFIDQNKFQKMIKGGQFLEWVEYGGNLYGTTGESIHQALKQGDVLWKIETSMAGKVKEALPEVSSIVIYLKVDEEDIRQRLKKRSLSETEIEQRLKQDREDWQKYHHKYDYIVENMPGQFDQTVEKVTEIIKKGIKS